MNLANFRIARRQIADLQSGQLQMQHWRDNCGTTACLAGWISIFNNPNAAEAFGSDHFIFARDFLDISSLAADWLFLAGWRKHDLAPDLWWVAEADLSLGAVSRARVLQELDDWIAAGDVPESLRRDPDSALDY